MIYLDHAATSLGKPKCVAEAVSEAIRTMGNPGRGAYEASLAASRTIYLTRKKIAAFFHMKDLPGSPAAERVIFTANATESLNIAIKGLLGPKDHIITTEMEHNSVLRPLYELEEKGASLTILPCDSRGCISYRQMEAAIRQDTKAIVCTHASNLTGNVNNIRKIGDICKKYNLHFILDAAQTAGVFEIDFEECHISALCFTGHKGLLGPQGTGGICVAWGIKIEPWKSGGSGVQSFERHHPAKLPMALEAGTLNSHGIAGLHAALDYISHIGIAQIQQKERKLAACFCQGIRKIPGICILGTAGELAEGKAADCWHAPIVSIGIAGVDSAEIADRLAQDYDIAVRSGAHCAPLMHQSLGTRELGAVRFSFSYANTIEEAEAAAAALSEIADSIRARVISYVGAGGKTGSLQKAAEQYALEGKKVLIASTARMALADVNEIPFVSVADDAIEIYVETVKRIFSKNRICAVGVIQKPTGTELKFSMPPEKLLEMLSYEADVLLVEADGAAHMAAKAPESFEPVLLSYTDEVNIVMGMHAVGKQLKEVCHRKEKVMEILSCGEEHIMTREDLKKLMEIGYERPLRKRYPRIKFIKIYYQKE